jgi:PAS domain S-box-containing protein
MNELEELRKKIKTLENEIESLKKLEWEIHDSKERFLQVTNTIDQVFWMTDPKKSDQLFISKAYEKIWGRSLESLKEDPESFLKAIHEEDRKKVIDALPNQIHGTYDIEYRVISEKDGKTRWVNDKAFPVKNADGQVYRVVGTVKDITEEKRLIEELKESDEKFFQVTNHIDDVFWMTDPKKSDQLFISKAYETIWGRSLESLREDPESFLKAIHEEDRKKVLDALPNQIHGTYDIEYRVISKKDGKTRWVNDKAFPVKNALGQIYRVVGIVKDITEEKRLFQELTYEKEKAEGLLENILPKAIIEELKNRGRIQEEPKIIGKKIESASVLFADIVGFTELSGRLDAETLVRLLNGIFSTFDHLLEKFKVEKIKTIGDAYMLAGGVPFYDPNHAISVAKIAIEMKNQLIKFNRENNQDFQIRMGIHSGPLVAGVIGIKKYIYDIWGDTVNIASRMESHGIPSEIQVTKDFADLVRENFLLEPRGSIDVKGKGKIETFLLREK